MVAQPRVRALGLIWWIFQSRYCPTQGVPLAQVRPEPPAPLSAGIVASTRPVVGSIFSRRAGKGADRGMQPGRAQAQTNIQNCTPLARLTRAERSNVAGQIHTSGRSRAAICANPKPVVAPFERAG